MESFQRVKAQMQTFVSERLLGKPKDSLSVQNPTIPVIYSHVENRPDHPLFFYGFPKEGSTHGNQSEFVMARTLQRHPNASVKKNLYRLHSSMAEKFKHMPDGSLEWLIGGSRKTSRGGFANVGELREFLHSNPEDIPSGSLITGLETISTAIGYRAIGSKLTEAPFVPKTPSQKKMYDVVSEITNGERVCAIGAIYRQRGSDRVVSHKAGENVILCEQDHTLSNSKGKRNLGQPNERIPSAQFKVTSENHQPSWISEAADNSIYVRNHVSGTAPLSLAAVTGLLRDTLTDEKEARDLYTALLLPQFLRSDYHSLAETQAGIDHFVAERKHKLDRTQPRSKIIDPKTAQQRAMQAMCNASSDSDDAGVGITPQQAMKDFVAGKNLDDGSADRFFESGEGNYWPASVLSPITSPKADCAFQRKYALQKANFILIDETKVDHKAKNQCRTVFE